MTKEFDYKYIKPLLKDDNLEGNILKCTFQATNQDEPLVAKHVLVVTEQENEITDSTKSFSTQHKISKVWNSLFKPTSKKIDSIYDQIPLTGNQRLLENRISNQHIDFRITSKLLKQSVVFAFKNIAPYYRFDGSKWIYAPQTESY
jgi:hypothetical protein